MSGRDENPKLLRCPNCGSTKFKYTEYGYNVQYVDIEQKTEYTSNWKTHSQQGWDCAACGRRLPHELQNYMLDLDWHLW